MSKEKDVVVKIKSLAVKALTTDGEHHKQWYLEEILKLIMPKEEFDEELDKGYWDEGIAP